MKGLKNKIILVGLVLVVGGLGFFFWSRLQNKLIDASTTVSLQNFIFLANDQESAWELYKVLPNGEKTKTAFQVFYTDDESFDPGKFLVSPDNNWVAYPVWDKGMNLIINISQIGSDKSWIIYPSETNEIIFDGASWSADSRNFFYQRQDQVKNITNYQFNVISGQDSLSDNQENN